MLDEPRDEFNPEGHSEFNPYRPLSAPDDETRFTYRPPWWQRAWVATVTVLKSSAYGMIAFLSIILFGTIGI